MTKRLVLLLVLAAVAAAVLAPTAGATRLLPLSAHPNGLAYEQWHVIWDDVSFNRSTQSRNSVIAVRGNKCGFAKGKVWLLPVSINGVLDVHCTIPQGKILAIVVAGWADWAKGENKLRKSMRDGFRLLERATLTVDGRSVRPGYVLQTPFLHVNMPVRNSYSVPPGPMSYMAKEHFALLSPLSAGEHLISTRGFFAVDDGVTLGFDYHLTIG